MIYKYRFKIVIGLVLFVSVFLFFKIVQASSTVRGKAWWNNKNSYLYLDCQDDVMGDRLDDPYNLCGGFLGNSLLCGTGVYAFHFYSAPCSQLVHHVSIDDNDNFSGEAWNYSTGLVSFAATSTPPDNYSFNSHCLNTCDASNNCSACYNEVDQNVYGWARVITSGEWIKLNSSTTATTSPLALQSWDLSNSVYPGHQIKPGDFVYTANSISNGAINFNCKSEWNGSSYGTCSTRDYKAYVENLQIGHLSAPNWSYSQACSNGARNVVLMWYAKSGWDKVSHDYLQSAFRVIINTNNSTSSPVFDSGKVYSTATQLICPGSLCAWTPNYGTSYYWWVKVWDNNDQPTPWYQYGLDDNHIGSLDEHTDGSSGLVFTTYLHEFPNPYFTWIPNQPLVGTSTYFTSNYASLSPSPNSCYGSCSYLWTTTDPADVIGTPTAATTSIIFYHATSSVVTFRVQDQDSYYCSTTTPPVFSASYNLPIWREIKAEQY